MEEGTPPRLAELRAELQALKLRQLQARAEQLGVDEQSLDDAEDKPAVMALILAKVEEHATADEAARRAALKEELGSMKLRPLQRKAEELGVHSDELDDAEDKAAVIALILELPRQAEVGTEPSEPGEPELEPEQEPEPELEPYVRLRHAKNHKKVPQPIQVVPMAERKYDFFINHCQQSGQDQCRTLATELKRRGCRVWYDMQADDLTAHGMEVGVSHSRNMLMFLSADLMARIFCQYEQRWAIKYGCKFVGIVEKDERHGKADFGAEKQKAPEDLKHLLDEVEFLDYQRREFQLQALIEEIMRRGGCALDSAPVVSAASGSAVTDLVAAGASARAGTGVVPGGITVFIAHRGTTNDTSCAQLLQRHLLGASAGTVPAIPGLEVARVVVCLLCHDETPFEQIHCNDDPMRLALAALFQGEQVVIPVVDSGFTMGALEGLPDDIRSLARQLFVVVDWRAPDAGMTTLLACIGQVRRTNISPILRNYLQSTIQQTETFKDPCTQETIHTETQCVPLKLLTVSELEESRKHSTRQIDEADRLLMRRRLGLGGTVGYGDNHAARSVQNVHEADVHFAEAREVGVLADAVMTVSVIVGPAACGKTTLLNRTTCGYAKDALRGCPGSMVPYVIRVMAFSRWLIKTETALTTAALKDFILATHCAGNADEGGLHSELMQLFEVGQLTLIFDGLDESGLKLDEITTFLSDDLGKNYAGRMIISSRESLFDESLFTGSRFQMLQIQPLTVSMQDDVLHRRLKDSRDVQGFKDQQSSSENLMEMGTNPLLLALQIGVFLLDDKQLPERRTELYEKGVRLLLRRVEAGETGARSVKATAAAVKPTAKRRRGKVDKRTEALMAVLCQTGYLLHVLEQTRDFAAGDVFEMLQNEDTDLGALGCDAAVEAWEDLLRDGRGILMCVEQDPDGDGDSMSDTWRSTHLTLQEYFAAKQCVINARASGDLLQNLKTVFGADPSPWLREVLLMVAEMLTQDEFKQLVDYYLEHDDDSGAASVRITTMLKCRREDTSTGVGAYVRLRLSQTRPVELMAEALCHPSDTLRTQALTEIEEFGMSKEEIAESVLRLISADRSVQNPWFLRLGGTQSLAKLQVCSAQVLLKLSAIGFGASPVDTGWYMDWQEEALRALKTLGMASPQSLDSVLISILQQGPADKRQSAWRVIRWLEISNDTVLDVLIECIENSEVSAYVAKMRAPPPEPEPKPQLEPEPELLEPEPGLELDFEPLAASPLISHSRSNTQKVTQVPSHDELGDTDEPAMPYGSSQPKLELELELELAEPETDADIDEETKVARLLTVLDAKASGLQHSSTQMGAAKTMVEAFDRALPGVVNHVTDLFEDAAFAQHVFASFDSTHVSPGVAFTCSIYEAASQLTLSAEVPQRARQAYRCCRDFEERLRQDHDHSKQTLLRLFGLYDSVDGSSFSAIVDLFLRLSTEGLRYYSFSPLLYCIRAMTDPGRDPTGERSELLGTELGARLNSIVGVESIFLRKELKVGKFERSLPFWTGVIEVDRRNSLSETEWSGPPTESSETEPFCGSESIPGTDWQKLPDATGAPYYCNTATEESVWDPPDEVKGFTRTDKVSTRRPDPYLPRVRNTVFVPAALRLV
eukprot:COSAG02_NODE_4682_length_5102_cov_11.871277_1_plen_1610_part_10